jgi:transposase
MPASIWASVLHVACVVNADGEVLDRFEFTHDAAAITGMIRRMKRGKVSGVAIERGDGPVVEALMDSDVAVYVVPPRQVKALRERYGSAGNKDDRFDAYLLADTLRSDGHRWRPLREESEATKALRALCRSRKDLVEVRVGVVNQLRANLELAFPGGIGLFAKPDSAITLSFLRRFPTARTELQLRLGDPIRMENLVRDLKQHRLPVVRAHRAVRTESVEIRTAMRGASIVHSLGGRPVPGDVLVDREEAVSKIAARLATVAYSKGAKVISKHIEEILDAEYFNVEPWPFAALVS